MVEKILANARRWASQPMSFSVHLQLIKSILLLYNHSGHPILFYLKLSTSRLKDLRSFLLKVSDLREGGVRVAWASVCLSFVVGGMVIERLET